ncbi:MAG: phage tail protein [Acidobacteriaceae bacterium]
MALGSNQNATPKLHSLQVTQSIYGIAIPILAGTARVPGYLLWYGDFNASGSAYSHQGGSGLGKGSTQYDYQASIVAALCHGPVVGIGGVWGQNGRLTLQSVTEAYTVPSGGGAYTVGNPNGYDTDLGVGILTPYSVTANDYGSPGPATQTGTYAVAAQVGTHYTTDGLGNYNFPSAMGGQAVQISYSYSLYVVTATEDYQVPNTYPYEITVLQQTTYRTNVKVFFIDTGAPLYPVGGTPSASGTYNPNNGNYLFAPADGLRPVAIVYTWRQSNSNLNPSATLSFTLLNGAQGQAPWSYLTSKHRSQALGYTTIATICAENMDLGPSGQIENYNYEVLGPFQFGAGIVDADCAVWIANFLKNMLWGVQFPGNIDDSLDTVASDYWNANSFFVSPLLDSAQPASDYISQWCEAGNVGVFWSENSLKFIPYGDTTVVGNGYVFSPLTAPVVNLDDTDFIVDADGDPVEISRTPWQDAYNEVHIQFVNRQNDYNDDSIVIQDDNAVALFGLRPEGQKDYSFLKTEAAANFAANIRLKRQVNIRRTFSFKISGLRYCFLEPMDLVTLTDVVTGLAKEPVRITKIEEDGNRVYSVTAEEFPWGTATATLYPKQPASIPPPLPSMADPGDTIATEVFEPPASVAVTVANSPYQIWMALTGGANWGGCVIMLSLDGDAYNQIGNQTGTSRGGKLTADLPQGSDPDLINTLSVETTGQLFNVSKQQADGFATLSKVGDEYLSYMNAQLTGSDSQTNDYNLTYLRRGVASTANIGHTVGQDFVRIDTQIFQYSYNPSLTGKTIYFKFLSVNLLGQMQQTLDQVSAYAYTVGGDNNSQNMTLTPVIAGGSWNIEVYQVGRPVGTAGSAQLKNGSTITLPAATLTGFASSTTYWVLYNLTTSAYQTFTDESGYLSLIGLGFGVGIGSTNTGSGSSYAPSNPGYTVLPDGTIVEWGTTGGFTPSTYAPFPEPLLIPASCLASTFSFGGVGSRFDRVSFINNTTLYGLTIANNGSNVGASWGAFSNQAGQTTLSDGTLIQWGQSQPINNSMRINFPSSMPYGSVPCVIVTTNGSNDRIPYVSEVDSTGFNVTNSTGNRVFWVAFSAPSGSSALSNGIIVKWGQTSMPGSVGVPVSFPTAFPANCWAAVASTLGGTDRITYVVAFSTTGVTIANNGSNVSANWMAFGN